jgi:hypothetical protein
VLESVVTASPPVTIQTVIIAWKNPDPSLTEEMFSIMVENAEQWSQDGWTALSRGNAAVHVNVALDKEQASRSLAPLIEFGRRLQRDNVEGVQVIVAEYPTWYSFFDSFASKYVAVIPLSLDILFTPLIDEYSRLSVRA